jgi:hypothetical protein
MRRLPSRSPDRVYSRLPLLPLRTLPHRPAFRQVSATPGPVVFRLRSERGTRPELAENLKAFGTNWQRFLDILKDSSVVLKATLDLEF